MIGLFASSTFGQTVFIRVDSTNNLVGHAFSKIIENKLPDRLIGIAWPSGDTLRLYGVKAKAKLLEVPVDKRPALATIEAVMATDFGGVVRCDISVWDTKTFPGIDLWITYNDTLLRLTEKIEYGKVFDGFVEAENLRVSGHVRIAMAAAKGIGISAPVKLCSIYFTKVGKGELAGIVFKLAQVNEQRLQNIAANFYIEKLQFPQWKYRFDEGDLTEISR